MGRTLPTSTQLIEEFEDAWRPYVRALRRQDQEYMAELFAMIRQQSAAIAYVAAPEPFQAFALAMLGGVLARVTRLELEIEKGVEAGEYGSAGG